jgi:hypothetical protein
LYFLSKEYTSCPGILESKLTLFSLKCGYLTFIQAYNRYYTSNFLILCRKQVGLIFFMIGHLKVTWATRSNSRSKSRSKAHHSLRHSYVKNKIWNPCGIPFPEIPISAILTYMLLSYGHLNIGGHAHFG